MRTEERVEITPSKFYALAEVIETLPDNKKTGLKLFVTKTEEFTDKIDQQIKDLSRSYNDLLQQLRLSTKERNNSFKPILDQVNDLDEDYGHTIGGNDFLTLAFNCLVNLQKGHHLLLGVANDLAPKELLLSDEKIISKSKTATDLQHMMYEIQLNTPTMSRFISGLREVDGLCLRMLDLQENVTKNLERYYRALLHRHSVGGLQIFRDAIVTDIAISVYENVDSHGEIADGKKPDEISAYTLHKAEVIAQALKEGLIAEFIATPGKFIEFVQENFRFLWESAKFLTDLFKDETRSVKSILELRERTVKVPDYEFDDLVSQMKDLDPRNVAYKEKSTVLSADERFNVQFRNETLKEVVRLMTDTTVTATDLIKYILTRKATLKEYFQDENSFYVCKIGNGNPFFGEAPGGLTVVPGERPRATLDEIVGSGFAEVKEFIKSVDAAAKWHDLFLATSPSKTTDKSNVLLIGPMGCLAGDTFIRYEVKTIDGKRVNHKGGSISNLYDRFNSLPQQKAGSRWREDVEFFAPSMTDDGHIIQNCINAVIFSGEKECFRITTIEGHEIVATADHKFFTGNGYTEVNQLKVNDKVFIHDGTRRKVIKTCNRNNERVYLFVKNHPVAGIKIIDEKYSYYRLARARAVWEAHMNNLSLEKYIQLLNDGLLKNLQFLPRNIHVHHKDENFLNDELANLIAIDGIIHNSEHAKDDHDQIDFIVVEDYITSIQSVGIKPTYDVQMNAPYHNVIANKFVVHNCGKSEILRAVASDKKSIGIFAQGSDFLTCWKGEAEKNPKRLFEAGLRIQKESKKHVHFLIDEIDSVLRKQEFILHGETNLSLEFQILMDGVVHYPNLSVWGATNNPERIPMPMIRRFSSLVVVGELDQKDRIHLLKQFVAGYLPTLDFTDEHWERAGLRLEGATGDVMRKVADHLWREKMSYFVHRHMKEAYSLMEFLNEGEKFNLSSFDEKKKFNFKQKLGKFVQVTPSDLQDCITKILANVAIKAEIETAVTTYKTAKTYLKGIV